MNMPRNQNVLQLFPEACEELRPKNRSPFTPRENAIISQYEQLRIEWSHQIDCLQQSARSANTVDQQRAEALDRELKIMERSLPESYICPEDEVPQESFGTVAAALARLLKCYRQHAEESAVDSLVPQPFITRLRS